MPVRVSKHKRKTIVLRSSPCYPDAARCFVSGPLFQDSKLAGLYDTLTGLMLAFTSTTLPLVSG